MVGLNITVPRSKVEVHIKTKDFYNLSLKTIWQWPGEKRWRRHVTVEIKTGWHQWRCWSKTMRAWSQIQCAIQFFGQSITQQRLEKLIPRSNSKKATVQIIDLSINRVLRKPGCCCYCPYLNSIKRNVDVKFNNALTISRIRLSDFNFDTHC